MNCLVRRWRPLLCLLVVALIVTAVPLPAVAQEPSQPAGPPGIRASVAPAVRAVAAKTTVAKEQAQSTPADKSQLSSGSFFKKPAGLIVLAVVAAGAGFAVYSASHDRIHSTVPASLQ